MIHAGGMDYLRNDLESPAKRGGKSKAQSAALGARRRAGNPFWNN